MKLILAGASILEVEAVADGDAFVVTIDADRTKVNFKPGHYKFTERVYKDSEVYDVASGTVKITSNLEQATEGSEQEWLETAITLLQAHIQGRLPTGMENYSIAGRAVSRIPVKDAVSLLSSFTTKLHRLQNPSSVGRSVLVNFRKTGYST